MALISYTNILTNLAQGRTQIIFINGLVPWTNELCCTGISDNYADNLSDYTKKLLDFDSRCDEELEKFIIQLRDGITSLDNRSWVNMFNAFIDLRIDRTDDGIHPGPNSHNLYAKMVIKHLENTW